jgi:hypothetical protein
LFAKPSPLNINLSSDRFSMFNKERDIFRAEGAGLDGECAYYHWCGRDAHDDRTLSAESSTSFYN